MKYFEVIKDKCTPVNFYKVASFYFYTTFVAGAFYSIYKYGLDIPADVSTNNILAFLMGFVFESSVVYEEKKKENEETVFIIEEMRNEIQQLKEKLGE